MSNPEFGNNQYPEHIVDLCMCPECNTNFVYPAEWEESGPNYWEVSLRCGNCEWVDTNLYPDEVVKKFDEDLTRGTETIVSNLRILMRQNIEDEVERLSAALQANAILPEDF